MNQELIDLLVLRKKLIVLEYARLCGSANMAYREFDIAKTSFYMWKKLFLIHGEKGLIRNKQAAHNHPRKLSKDVIEQILDLRKRYHLGSQRIVWYLERYHGIDRSQTKHQDGTLRISFQTFNDRPQAELAKGLLEKNGIGSVTSADNCSSYRPHLSLGSNGVHLLVKENDVEKAKDILNTK
ncbi:MAG: DUF2007 domain-containing protein [Candidatus Theseobacter exili]|nr:DUF2007 domain-containing protein [Candidatus Theseobacter exili]